MPYSCRGQEFIVPSVKARFFPACGEAILDPEEVNRVSKIVQDFQYHVNNTTVPPSFIVNLRRKLGLELAEAATILGETADVLGAYEGGKAKPPASFVILLKRLDPHPELLAELRAR